MKFLFALLFVSTSLIAEDFAYDPATGKAMPKFIGEVKLVKGQVFKETQGQRLGLKEGGQLYPGDTLLTEEKSFVRVLMVDQSTINLGPSTTLNFESFKFKSNTERQAVFNLIKGQLRSLVKHKAKDGDLRFRSKDALMGIRGTELLVNQHTTGQVTISEFALLSGKAEVKEGQGQLHQLSKHDRLVIVHGEKPRRQKLPLTESEIDLLEDEEEFLPPTQLASLGEHENHDTTDVPSEDEATPTTRQGTLKNLEMLNEQLRENQKRTR